MPSITLHHVYVPRKMGSVTTALHNLAVATHQLISALGATLINKKTNLTVGDEADDLRDMAYRLSLFDPRFAEDLYAAAARHELGDNAG